MSRDKHVSIVKVVVISTKPNNPKAVGEKSFPVKPTVEGFAFEFLLFLLPVGRITSSEQLFRFETRLVNQLIPEMDDIRVFEEDVINDLLLILAKAVARGN